MKYEDLTGNLKTLYDFHINGGTITIESGTIDSVKGVFTLQEILDKNDDWWESEHNFIQWLYPTDEPSKFNENSPVLTKEFTELFADGLNGNINPDLYYRFALFIKRTNCLESVFNHNYLRFSRVLRCIALLCGKEEALFIFETYCANYHLFRVDNIQSLHIWLDSTQAEFK